MLTNWNKFRGRQLGWSGNQALWGKTERIGHVYPWEKKTDGDMIALFKCLKGCRTEEGKDLFSVFSECRTCKNGIKLQEARFWLNIRKNLLTTVLEQYSNGINYFKRWWVLQTGGIQKKLRQPPGRYPLICFPASSWGWTQWPFRPLPTSLFYNSMISCLVSYCIYTPPI